MKDKPMSNQSKTLTPGTISHGTMREEHLIPRFLNALESVRPEKANAIREEHADTITSLKSSKCDWEAVGWLLNEVLFDALNECCPKGFYFGSHPGDGSDYGVWECGQE